MTREEFSQKIGWGKIIRIIGIVNPCFMLPQLHKIWDTETAAGISLTTMLILFVIQAGFGTHGFFLRDKPLMWSNAAAATVTVLTSISASIFGASW